MIHDQSISIRYDMELDMDEGEADNMNWDEGGPSRANTPVTGPQPELSTTIVFLWITM